MRLKDILRKGYTVTLASTVKRMEVDGERDWHQRFIWKVRGGPDDIVRECEWEGFAKAEEAIADLENSIK